MKSDFASEKEIILETTGDGSPTLYVPEWDEHYHSMNGAVAESLHVYIKAGLNQYIRSLENTGKELQVLELGFGAGLNALLTAIEAERQKVKIRYTALEKYPLSQTITDQLYYLLEHKDLFRRIHQSAWEIPVSITPYFTLQKSTIDFVDYDFPAGYDVVYYDAFAPDKQPEVWSPEIFAGLFSAMNPGGILTTYCAKGSVRRMMLQAGFFVERIPGAPGKREMLRACVSGNTDYRKEKKEQKQQIMYAPLV